MKQLLFTLFLVTNISASAQRTIFVEPKSIFPFDPLTTYYVKESLAPVDTYVKAWRGEGEQIKLVVGDSSLCAGFRFYIANVDKTLLDSVLSYLNAESISTISPSSLPPWPNGTIYNFPASKDFITHFDADIERVKRFFATPIAILDSAATFDPYAPSQFSQLFHSFQLQISGADLSLFAPPFMSATLPSEIFVKTIFNIFRFDNDLVVVSLKGGEIKELLEKFYGARYFTLTSERSDLLAHRAPAYLNASLAGAKYEVDLTRQRGSRILNLGLETDTIYSVAMNSYAARELKVKSNMGNYKTLFINYLRADFKTKNSEQWKLKPERWVEKIKLREMSSIFGK